jgi:hypothetical protein
MTTTKSGNILTVTRDAETVVADEANFAVSSGVKTFGSPFSGDVNAATAQAALQPIAAPATGKIWQRLQMFIRWTTAPVAPVAGTPDAIVVIYWYDGTSWHTFGHWPAKYIDGSSSVADMQTFSDYSELPFPARATRWAVGVAGYVDGEFYVDLEAAA